MSARAIPIVNLEADQDLTAEQIVQAANGEARIFIGGEKAGITLSRKDRVPFMAAISLGYLKYLNKQTPLAEVFHCWCEAKELPCLSFEIEDDCVDILFSGETVENNDPFVTMHFDTTTTGRPFGKKGLVLVTVFLLGHVWDLTLSPWKISAGVLRFSVARELMNDLYKIWVTTSEPNAEGVDLPVHAPDTSGSQMIH